MKSGDLYTGQNTVFVIKGVYAPNEENDVWVEYFNQQSNQSYTCRQEAFLSRFVQLAA